MNKTTLVSTVVLMTLFGCGSDAGKVALPASAAEPTPREATVVTTASVESRAMSLPVIVTGTTRPLRVADLAAGASGRIERIFVDEGEVVKTGQALVLQDTRTTQLSLTQARATAAAAHTQAQQLEADHARLAPLAERGSTPQSRVDQLASQRDGAKAQAAASDAAVEAAARIVQNATLRAPFAGTVIDVPVEIGEMASTQPATTLVRLADLSKLEIAVRAHERDLGRIAVGDPVTARFPNLQTEVVGKISRIGLEVDVNTRTAEVVAVIDNADRALRAGVFTELTIVPSSTRTLIAVPKSAVSGADDEAVAYVIADGKAQRRKVRVAGLDNARVEVLDGLKAGEVIATSQLDRLIDGAAVTVNGDDAQTRKP